MSQLTNDFCSADRFQKYNLATLLEKFSKDVDSAPDDFLAQTFAFIAFIKSQPIPKVPTPPPDLEPFDIDISERIEEISAMYKRNLDKQKYRQERDEAVQKSSTDIIRSIPDLLKERGKTKESGMGTDLAVSRIAEYLLYPNAVPSRSLAEAVSQQQQMTSPVFNIHPNPAGRS